ncbi:helix-turn-helix domain-containing protein [Aquimarina rubra]|uniref:Helix-turn-helix domain-containing protein n=1 Tax=Aquimarina rubra TaxID=1920033 RepID=A0ABW5LCI4_9FLAO
MIPAKREINDGKEELEEVIKRIENHINEKKSYLNPDINLKSFSKDIRLPERIISRAINRIEHKNFNGYINSYRVKECKRLLLSEKYEQYSISAIADEVGFSSRASFYKNFKEIAGVSPSEYIKSVNN